VVRDRTRNDYHGFALYFFAMLLLCAAKRMQALFFAMLLLCAAKRMQALQQPFM